MADDNATIQQMREEIKNLKRERDELSNYKTEVMEIRKGSVAKELGFDGDLPKGLMTLHGDGEFTADALRKTAEENGWNLPAASDDGDAGEASGGLPDTTQQRLAVSNQIREAQGSAVPAQGQTMPFEDWKALATTNPAEAVRLQQAKLVDIPAHISGQLAVNRESTPLGR